VPLPVSLQAIVDAIDLANSECRSYLHRDTGDIVTLTEGSRPKRDDDPEREENLPDWE
jgi:hypothetical protein